jgi:hypothetical protein
MNFLTNIVKEQGITDMICEMKKEMEDLIDDIKFLHSFSSFNIYYDETHEDMFELCDSHFKNIMKNLISLNKIEKVHEGYVQLNIIMNISYCNFGKEITENITFKYYNFYKYYDEHIKDFCKIVGKYQ